MSDAYIAEIRAFGFNFAPVDWAQCNGQTMSISQDTALFSIIGTTYGGNGQTTFNLPNLQSETVVGMGQGAGLRNWPLGAVFGEASHTLLITEVPTHNHTANAATKVNVRNQTANPTANSLVGRGENALAFSPTSNTVLNAASIGIAGGSQPHPNVQPVQVLNFCICLFGVFPSHS